MKAYRPLLVGSSLLIAMVGCSSDSGDFAVEGDRAGAGTGGTNGQGSTALGGSQAQSGEEMTGSGGMEGPQVLLPPVDCSAIADSWHLCSSDEATCSAVFDDGAGCSTVCASAGLVCAEVWEDLSDSCSADSSRPALACAPSSGHQSDFCVCKRDPSLNGSGGATSSTGGSGSGGASSTGGTSSGGSVASGGTTSSGGNNGSGGGSNGNTPCEVPDYIFNDTTPIGWAAQNGGTTGGGSATATLVTSLAQLQNAVKDDTAAVIYVQGTLSPGKIDIGSNKTIIGCSSGAHIQGTVSIGRGSQNIIMRNLNISGYGIGNCALDPAYDSAVGCSSGNDAVGINGDAHHVWVDHCSVKDGTDGNLDITNDADFVTVSWTKFSYTARGDHQGDDSTGSAGHRYSNLVGGTNTNPSGFPSTRPLNVTWHHNWWADGIVERQPRVRFGRNHIFNNYYSSAISSSGVRAGKEARVLLQANYFHGTTDSHEFNNSSDQSSASISVGSGSFANAYVETSGERASGGGGEAWTTPPYAFSVESSSGVPSKVMSGAGPH